MNKLGCWLLVVCAAVVLVACGGGGENTAYQPPTRTDYDKPFIQISTPTPLPLDGPIVFSSNEALGPQISVSVVNGAQVLPGNAVLGEGGLSIVWTPAERLPYNTSLSLTVVASDLAGNVHNGTTHMVATDPDRYFDTWWPPKTVTPMGVKVFGANQLPTHCLTMSDPCWHEAIVNGTVKFIKTTAVMTGYNTRPIVFAYFRTANNLWSSSIVYADTGEMLLPEIASGVMTETDWVYGTESGLIVHEKPTGLCYEITWYPPSTTLGNGSNVWATYGAISCP